MQRNFGLLRKQFEAWKGARPPDESAKLVIFRAFVVADLDLPKRLAPHVRQNFARFVPQLMLQPRFLISDVIFPKHLQE